MDEARLKALLNQVAAGKRTPAAAASAVKAILTADLGFAHVDHHRAVRCGFPEVILCEGKTPAQVADIAAEILRQSEVLLATRVSPETAALLKKLTRAVRYNPAARCVVIDRRKGFERKGLVAVVTAGTADVPVAEEAKTTAEVMGARVVTAYDAGVAGIHRIMGKVEKLREARAIVVAAGMEGALASVVGGLVDRPVIAVPTSQGYGASFRGVAALLGMLNSCAANVSVVNIDNGFGAGYIAALVNRLASA